MYIYATFSQHMLTLTISLGTSQYASEYHKGRRTTSGHIHTHHLRTKPNMPQEKYTKFLISKRILFIIQQVGPYIYTL